MVGSNSLERTALLVERAIIVVDAGQDFRRDSEDRILYAQSRRDRPGLQRCIVIGGREGDHWRRAEEAALGVLLAVAAVDDQGDAVQQSPGEACGRAGALLVAIVERR